MGTMASQSPASRLFTQAFIRAQIKENIKAPRHWPLYREVTGDQKKTTGNVITLARDMSSTLLTKRQDVLQRSLDA